MILSVLYSIALTLRGFITTVRKGFICRAINHNIQGMEKMKTTKVKEKKHLLVPHELVAFKKREDGIQTQISKTFHPALSNNSSVQLIVMSPAPRS